MDSERKRAAATTVGMPWVPPSVRPDGALTSFDRWQMGWSYRAAATGTLMFYGTTLTGGVVASVFDGITFDDSGNLRASGAVYEGP